MTRRRIQYIHRIIPGAFRRDRIRARGELGRIKKRLADGADGAWAEQRLARLEKELNRSAASRRERVQRVPALSYPEALPITARKEELIRAIAGHRVIIVSGETGSGKTTQIPKFCLAAGRGIDGIIGCTQPRRIAATTVARRIAEELGEAPGCSSTSSASVGHKIRFQDRFPPNGFIKVMTDGVLLAETQADPRLSRYDTLIVDEAHERSLNIDFILGLLKNLMARRRNLHLIITSATIDTEKFSAAFDGAPVIEVSGRMYPVQVRYMPLDEKAESENGSSHIEMAARVVDRLQRQSPFGDILVFMPTEQGIRETRELIEAKNYPGVMVLPLFARLTGAEQARVFAPAGKRKIVIATNIAETSITIPGIRYVIDSGLARISRYNPRTRTTALPVTEISKSSADQRKGRCGRVENGVCIRLYSEDNYQARPLYTPPEILRANLAEVILRMISLRLGDVDAFPFVDRPAPQSVRDGFNLLLELGAIVPAIPGGKKKKRKPSGRFCLTPMGRVMAKMPVDPRLSRILLASRRAGCLKEVAVIAAALCTADPRRRPAEKTQAADAAQQVFKDPASDFITLFNIWKQYHDTWKREKTTGRMKKFCAAHFLSFKKIREWRDVHAQLCQVLKENSLDRETADVRRDDEKSAFPHRYQAIHKSLLAGFLSSIAVKKEKNLFRATKGREVMLFPGSALFNRPPSWIVAAEMVETSRLFARTCAAIDNAWLEEIGGDLCNYSYSDPHWEKNRGEVVAAEQVSLFGLIVESGRPKAYGPVDPEAAAEIFIRSALIEGEIKQRFDFIVHNRRLVKNLQSMEDRLRRRDILVGQEEMLAVYRQRLGPVFDQRTLAAWIRRQGGDEKLRMTRDDLVQLAPDPEALSRFPKRIHLDRQKLACTYRFDPDHPADGITIRVPTARAASVSPEATEWLVPGMLREKIEAMIRALPKIYRKQLVPVTDTVATVMARMPRTDGSLVTALGKFLHDRYKVDIPASAWSTKELPDHLRARIALIGPEGTEIRSSRDPSILRAGMNAPMAPDRLADLRSRWERTDLAAWDFGDLPESISVPGRSGWSVFPALVVENERVCLRLLQNEAEAASAHPDGVAALASLALAKDLSFLKRSLKLPSEAAPWARTFGGAAGLQDQCYRRLVHDMLKKNIRCQTDFTALAAEAGPRLRTGGQDLIESVRLVIKTGHDTLAELGRMARSHTGRAPLIAFIDARRADLDRLIPNNFIEIYDRKAMGRLDRYARAIALRTCRALVDLEKDSTKAAGVRPFTRALMTLLDTLSADTTLEKRRAVEDFFWLLEEFKVSVFAQELKTAVPVSRKRLERRLGEIERMI